MEVTATSSLAAKSGLLVIDMQNDFVLPDAPLVVKGGMAALPSVQRAVAVAREAGIPVFWIIREHHPSGADVELSRRHFFEPPNAGICVAGTPGAALVAGLEPAVGEPVVIKKRWSAFFQTVLDLHLRRLGVTSVVIAGVQTPNCIRGTAFDAVALDYEEVVALSDATAAGSPAVHEANLLDMRNAGIFTPTVDEWNAQLRSSS